MKIIIDVIRVVRRSKKNRILTGIDRVTIAYVRHFSSNAHALVRYFGRNWVLSKPASQQLFFWLIQPKSKSVLLWLLLKDFLMGQRVQLDAKTILLNTGPISPKRMNYYSQSIQQGVKPIFFVHDLIPMIYPEFCSPREDERHRAKIEFILAVSAGIITNSQATLDDLTQFIKNKGLPLPKTAPILLGSGISLEIQLTTERMIEKPYFVMLCTIEPRKNHLLLLQIWRKMVMQYGEDKVPHLVLIGQRGWECEQTLDLLDRSVLLKSVILEKNKCSDRELLAYLKHAQALLFPSFSEGFGLPIIEALTLGVPVIASDLPVFREIAGDIPDYADALDAPHWERLILAYAAEQSLQRNQQIERMQTFKAPDWDTHFAKVNDFLQEVI